MDTSGTYVKYEVNDRCVSLSEKFFFDSDHTLTILLVSEDICLHILCIFMYKVAATFTEFYDVCSYVENVYGSAAWCDNKFIKIERPR